MVLLHAISHLNHAPLSPVTKQFIYFSFFSYFFSFFLYVVGVVILGFTKYMNITWDMALGRTEKENKSDNKKTLKRIHFVVSPVHRKRNLLECEAVHASKPEGKCIEGLK